MRILLSILLLSLSLCAGPVLTIETQLPDYSFTGNVGGPELHLFCIDFFKSIAETPWPVTITHYTTAAAPLWVKQLDWIDEHATSTIQESYALWEYASLGASPHAEGSTGLLLSMAFVPWSSWATYVPDVTTYFPVDICLDTQPYVEFGDGTQTPEPSTMSMGFGLGLIGAVLMSRGQLSKR